MPQGRTSRPLNRKQREALAASPRERALAGADARISSLAREAGASPSASPGFKGKRRVSERFRKRKP